jgi:hypothetical protein
MAKVKKTASKLKAGPNATKTFPRKKKPRNSLNLFRKKWEYFDQMLPSNSKFFAFWRNFAPKTTLLHLPNKIEKNKSPCSQRKGGNPSTSFGRHQQLVKAVRSSSLLHRLHLCACIGDLRRLVWQPFCILDKCLRRCYEPMNAGAHTPMNSRFQKPMNHESCLL